MAAHVMPRFSLGTLVAIRPDTSILTPVLFVISVGSIGTDGVRNDRAVFCFWRGMRSGRASTIRGEGTGGHIDESHVSGLELLLTAT